MKKKGFTLIELLAVLVVLAILALITIPLVIGIIKNVREKANERSIEAYGRAVENAVGVYLLNNPTEQPTTIPLTNLNINTSGKTVTCDNTNVIINTNGSIRLESCYVEGTEQKYNYENRKLTKVSTNDNSTSPSTTYNAYSVGDTFTLNGDSYHIIENSGTSQDYVVALKDIPLTVSEVETYGVGHINRHAKSGPYIAGRAYDTNGYGNLLYYSNKDTCGYNGTEWVFTDCKTSYDDSEVRYAVDAWALDTFKHNELKTVDNYKARLLKYDELTSNLGYAIGLGTTGPSSNGVTPDWVYSNQYDYWTMSSKDDSSSYVWYVSNDGGYLNNCQVNEYANALRPVINVYKDKLPE